MDAPIRYTIVASPYGRLLVAATPQGVCAVSLADGEGPLRQFLRDEFPGAEPVRDDASLRKWSAAILRHLKGRGAGPTVPIDAQGTPFQKRVWRALCKIPYGETSTYREVARSIGRPKAVRAVARACATNPVALVVPCHRVIRTDGNLAGYRWGLQRKQALLDRESRLRLVPA
jgi:AraC family transcriptional regulator of adaptative response/methylated-DNA-[protein]-cysteine methyltransferase